MFFNFQDILPEVVRGALALVFKAAKLNTLETSGEDVKSTWSVLVDETKNFVFSR